MNGGPGLLVVDLYHAQRFAMDLTIRHFSPAEDAIKIAGALELGA